MTELAAAVNQPFLTALGTAVKSHSAIHDKPLCIDLISPYPPRLRVYLYGLVGGVGTVRPNEYKAVLRLRGQAVGEYASFDHSGGRFTLVVGYRADLDVFVLWDASLHHKFKNGGNIQVQASTVHEAAVSGRADQKRTLTSVKVTELVIACQSSSLTQALDDRIAWTGGEEDRRGRSA